MDEEQFKKLEAAVKYVERYSRSLGKGGSLFELQATLVGFVKPDPFEKGESE